MYRLKMEDSTTFGEGRCERCLQKLVFMVKCDALGCGRWVCEHNLVKKKLGSANFLVCNEGSSDTNTTVRSRLEIEFCSEECSFGLVDEYLIRRKHKLQSSIRNMT